VLEHLLLVAKSRAVQRPAPFACAKNKRALFGNGSARAEHAFAECYMLLHSVLALAPQTGHSSRFCSKMREKRSTINLENHLAPACVSHLKSLAHTWSKCIKVKLRSNT
jgi:hypothetical protein